MTNPVLYKGYYQHAKRVSDSSEDGPESMRSYYESHLLPHLPINRNAKILEIGCGFGRILYVLRKAKYANLYGIDISPDQVAAAHRLGFTYVECADMKEYLGTLKKQFDVIILFDVLEHIPKGETIDSLRLIRESLAADGMIILQAPNAFCLLSPYVYGDFTHESAFTSDSIHQVLEMAGFDGIQVYPTEPHIHGALSFFRAILWKTLVKPMIRLYLAISLGDTRCGGVYTANLIAKAYSRVHPT